jgi:two-component system sensor histidine kinase MprB
VGVAVALASAASFFVVRGRLLSQVDDSLRRQAELVAQTKPIDANGNIRIEGLSRLRNIRVSGLIVIQVVSQEGTVLIGDSQTRVPFSSIDAQVAGGDRASALRSVAATSSSVHERVLTFPAGPGYAFQLAYPLTDIDHTLGELGLVLVVVALAGVGLALGLGYVVAQAALRPVQRLTAAAEHVAATQQLDATIEPGGDDELGRLARSFNAMLGALAASRSQQSQLVADAGHELRTPLTSLRTNLDLLTQADRQGGLSEASRAELLDDVRFQIEELTTLIGDLTELARDEPARFALEDIDLAEITERAVQRVRRRASSLDFDLHVEPWWVTGDSAALERAVTNLLDNAAKWSPPLGRVTVRLTAGSLMVADQGHGIAESDLPHVVDRF